MKTTDGHGGAEVFWIADEEEYQKRRVQLTNRAYILQQPSDTLGKDMRIYAIGGQIVGAVLRSSTSDFRSNFSLGGCVEKATVTKEQRAIVKTLYQALQPV